MALKHLSTESCSDYLPKPKRRYEHLIAQCSFCKTLFVCLWAYGYYWTELKDK